MTSNHRNVNVEIEKQDCNQNDSVEFSTLRNHTTIYHTYQWSFCKGHIQMTSNHSNVNVQIKKTIE